MTSGSFLSDTFCFEIFADGQNESIVIICLAIFCRYDGGENVLNKDQVTLRFHKLQTLD